MNIDKVFIPILFLILLSWGCSGGDNTEPLNPDPEPVWDKSRTVKVSYITDLSGNNPFTVNTYSTVASFLKGSDSHLILLDKSNVRSASPRLNPGASIAVASDRVPLFVSTSRSSDTYIGNTILFSRPLRQMELTQITEDCRLMKTRIELRPGLSMNVATLSFNKEEQIKLASQVLKKEIEQSVLITGTIRRDQLSIFEVTISEILQEGLYNLDIFENSNRDSIYCVYVIGSRKWKFRNGIETSVQNNLKSILLEVEYLK